VELNHPTSQKKKHFKPTPSVGKVKATGFGDTEGMILVDVRCCQSINSGLYIQTRKTLQKHMRSVLPHKNVAAALLQHDSA
jgi:hypothetical protein